MLVLETIEYIIFVATLFWNSPGHLLQKTNTDLCHFNLHYDRGATALKPDLNPKLPAVVRSYDRDFVVPLYNCTTVCSKTQYAHNFGHGYATDLYFTFLRMAKKVFLVKFFWHRRDSNPRPVLVIIFCNVLGAWC